MPDLTFRIRWPDGGEELCYSPSSIVREFYAEGETYPLDTFMSLSERAFHAASERVRAVYGYPCSRAAAQLAALRESAAPFRKEPGAAVTFLRFETDADRRISS